MSSFNRIDNNGSEFKLHFEYLCDSYDIMRKPTTVKNPWANGILERVHQVLGQMLCTAELDMADSVTPNDVDVFLDNAAWAIRSTYHTVLKASPGAAIFGQEMLFDIPFVADWRKIGERRQSLTNRGNQRKNAKRIDYDYKVRNKVLLINEGILHKAESTREDVVAELILMVNPLYRIMSVAMLNYEWCLALRSDLGTSGVWPK